jgi:hypothetical protein
MPRCTILERERNEIDAAKVSGGGERHSYISTPHTSTSMDPVHWKDPNAFDPTRYLSVPTSAQITEDKCRQIGLARCPFDITNFEVKDGRKVNVTNQGRRRVSACPEGAIEKRVRAALSNGGGLFLLPKFYCAF